MDKSDVLPALQVTQVPDVRAVFRDTLEIQCNLEITVKYQLAQIVSVTAVELSPTPSVM